MNRRNGGKTGLDYLDSRILSFYQEALLLRSGRMCRPRFALLYPTYVCNHTCVGCDYTTYNRRAHPATLDSRQLSSIVDQVAELGVRAVELCGGGEPLLHPGIDGAIERARGKGLSVGLLTNGTTISDARARLLAEACAYVRVSLEAGTAETFARVKRPKSRSAGFARVLRNVASLVAWRDRLGTACQVSLKVAIDENNQHDLEAAVGHAVALGVDSIQFKCIRNVPSELSLADKRRLSRTLDELRSRTPGLRVLGDLLPYRVTVPCWLSPLHVMIDAVGDVFVCCYYRHRVERHRFGNVLTKPLHAIWYSREHLDTLAAIRPHECEKYDCRFIKYAQTMDEAMTHAQLDFL